ncbi:propanediol utilization phosphotransacetylase [Carboxydocella sp. ULO1]|nr:propanediol utilization phosphotransacetylase [Carboxydocella sp. ULO1]
MVREEILPAEIAAPVFISPYLEPYPEPWPVPVGISARHIHLTQRDLEELFGPGYQLTPAKPLSQPGQYAAQETLTLVGPKGVLEEVRILGPCRPYNQVELSGTDAYQLGLEPPIRDSGDLDGTPGIVLVGPRGSVDLPFGVIKAAPHLHLDPATARQHGLEDGDRLQILAEGEKEVVFNNVLVRVSRDYLPDFHLDTDEANAAGIRQGQQVLVIAKRLLPA